MWCVLYRYYFDGQRSETFSETFWDWQEAIEFEESVANNGAEDVVCLYEALPA